MLSRRRNAILVEEVYEHDNIMQSEQRLEQRIEQLMEEMTQRMTDLLVNLNCDNPNPNGRRNHHQNNYDEFIMGDEDEDTCKKIPQDHRKRQKAPIEDGRRRWEIGMRTKIPKSHGSLKAEDFLDWLATVEEILEFKWVSEDKCVPLVVSKLHGRAIAWWQQLKLTPNRLVAHQRALLVEKLTCCTNGGGSGNSFSAGNNTNSSSRREW
ncbi:conserved hypothetical protein [Ricinus communis]|uniref:Retrotransposon gag domain-containing protein n=1 Tax=Ricinus communis TaxID=3988 RepID=B9RPE5_RICCO|nr:conserved hypothetical protein [Ricinus communis]